MADYVLVHGAWHGAWCWDKLVPLLEAAGHRAYTPTLTGVGERAALLAPGIGLDTHIQDVTDLIEENDLRQVILVGHSYSGMVITGVADSLPDRIARLVYLDAVVPRDGQSMASAAHLGALLRYAARRHGDGWRVNPPGERRPGKGGLFDVTREPDLGLVRSRVTPQPLKTFLQTLHLSHPEALAAIPRTFIECTDRGAAVALMRRIMRRALPQYGPGWERRTLRSGHDAMIIAPQELALLLLEVSPTR
ncbi:alpha/beta fold hydrolase [Raineyella fluvialis]|uniref:Alpha/beta fold hydrolase n=1 Tax=Raineyella fluvialis TaxID=2662261 RepID=A0A5Q2FFY6_9ACTN|nr:alpha/beta fold hydrolase [Raineyella fluvialis]QGF24707.1 alpha/beta fold hydrolase [Raineyella fluvialis]